MVEINSVEDLKPFMKYVPAKYVNGKSAYLNFEITTNDELQDVTINCELDLTFSFDNIFSNLFNVEELIAHDYMAQSCDIKFVAKNIYIKNNFICDYVKCDNIYFNKDITINFLVAYGTVKGKTIYSRDIMCHTIYTRHVNCDCVNVIKFRSKSFYSNGIFFSNVTYHQPDFSENLIDSWHGVKINKYEIAKDYEKLPF